MSWSSSHRSDAGMWTLAMKAEKRGRSGDQPRSRRTPRQAGRRRALCARAVCGRGVSSVTARSLLSLRSRLPSSPAFPALQGPCRPGGGEGRPGTSSFALAVDSGCGSRPQWSRLCGRAGPRWRPSPAPRRPPAPLRVGCCGLMGPAQSVQEPAAEGAAQPGRVAGTGAEGRGVALFCGRSERYL